MVLRRVLPLSTFRHTSAHTARGRAGMCRLKLNFGDHSQGSPTCPSQAESCWQVCRKDRVATAGRAGEGGTMVIYLSPAICPHHSQFQGFHHCSTKPVDLKVWSLDWQQQHTLEGVQDTNSTDLLTEKPGAGRR